METGVVRVRQHRGTYGKQHRSRGLNLEVGTVTVRSGTPEKRLPFGSRGVRAQKEDVGDVSRIKWFEKYHPPKGVILDRGAVTASLKAIKGRRPDFRLPLAERFAEAVRVRLNKRPRISHCLVEVVRRGCYPLNTDVGVFLEVRVSGERFVVPATFLPVEAKVKPKRKHK